MIEFVCLKFQNTTYEYIYVMVSISKHKTKVVGRGQNNLLHAVSLLLPFSVCFVGLGRGADSGLLSGWFYY